MTNTAKPPDCLPETHPLARGHAVEAPRVPGLDGRKRRARRIRAAYAALADELGHEPSRAERLLLFDAALLAALSEESAATQDVDQRMRVSHALGEALRRLGLAPRRTPDPPDPRAEAEERLRRWRAEDAK